jgi:hypothetical protein
MTVQKRKFLPPSGLELGRPVRSQSPYRQVRTVAFGNYGKALIETLTGDSFLNPHITKS